MLRILTDTGSDITPQAAAELGVELLALDIRFEEFDYDYLNDHDFSVFYKNLEKSKGLPKTSLLTPQQYMDVFEDVKAKGDEMLVITISSGLSGTYSSAVTALEAIEYDGITLVDSLQASITQRMLVERAVKLRDDGKTRGEIAEEINRLRERVSFIVLLDTLKYLKKGGRVPPVMAVLGEALKIKPAVTFVNGKVEQLGKARGAEKGKQIVWEKFEKDGHAAGSTVSFGYTDDKARGEEFMLETVKKYGLSDYNLRPVGGVIGTHGGPGGIGFGYFH